MLHLVLYFGLSKATGLLNDLQNTERKYPDDDVWRIGYITKFGVQKDFNAAFHALSILKRMNKKIKLVLTLSKQTKEFPKVQKMIDQPLSIEALFYGQAGMLNRNFSEQYPNELKKEYQFLENINKQI